MARTQALGGWLQQTKGKVQERRVSGTMKEREKMASQLLAWRVRGCLWAASVALSVSGHLSGAYTSIYIRSTLLTAVNRRSWAAVDQSTIIPATHHAVSRSIVHTLELLGSHIRKAATRTNAGSGRSGTWQD